MSQRAPDGRQVLRVTSLTKLRQMLALIWLGTAWLARLAAQPAELPPLTASEAGTTQLLANPGFEEPDRGWHLSDWPPREGTSDKLIAHSIFFTNAVVHSGQSALCFDHSTVGPERLLGISQGLSRQALAAYDGRRCRLSAWFWLAAGPPYYQGTLGMRQWSGSRPAPFGGVSLPIGGSRGEWFYCAREFTFALADTQRADVNVWLPNVPDPAQAPRIFVDDVRLEVLADPVLRVDLLCGAAVFAPDDRLPLRITVSATAWQEAMTHLRWDVTTADGRRSYGGAEVPLSAAESLLEVRLPRLPEGAYALRCALGRTAGGRTHEVLVSFRYAVGPFAPDAVR